MAVHGLGSDAHKKNRKDMILRQIIMSQTLSALRPPWLVLAKELPRAQEWEEIRLSF